MANLFDKAKAKGATAAGKSKPEKTEVVINDPGFHLTLSRLAEVNAEIDALSAESAVLGAEVKERGIKEYSTLYEQTLKHPGSFNIKAEVPGQKPASMMFIAADRYIKINEERSEELKTKYGEDIVEEKTIYVMDTKLVEQYGEVISKLIENCKIIPDADKEKLISAVVAFEIKKGTIGDLKTKYASVPVNEVLEDIRPVFQLKNIKIED